MDFFGIRYSFSSGKWEDKGVGIGNVSLSTFNGAPQKGRWEIWKTVYDKDADKTIFSLNGNKIVELPGSKLKENWTQVERTYPASKTEMLIEMGISP
ncbi:hypothetical protein [Bacillus cereus]|uniref:hypothetical protein n=1 Tax=Bacillus cereus TaxID=1396 RepID=UPI0003A43379|nr:hypothetical protein [Bacillus cereus]